MFGARISFLVCCLAALVMVGSPTRADMLVPPAERDSTFVVGRISGDLRRTLLRLDAMAGHMAGRLADAGYRKGHGVVVSKIEEMARLLREGEIDMISESPLAAVQLADMSGAEIVLREWKDKTPVYRGVVIVAKNSNVQQLTDLRGKRIALEDRSSTTGFLLPLAALKAAGLPLVELARPDDEVPAGAVGYIFTQSELNISSWTARGLVDAGAFSDQDFEDGDRTPKRMRNDLRIIHLSPPVIRSMVLLRPGLPAARRDRILAELLALGADESNAALRHEYYRLRRYDELDADGHRSLGEVRAALAALGPSVLK